MNMTVLLYSLRIRQNEIVLIWGDNELWSSDFPPSPPAVFLCWPLDFSKVRVFVTVVGEKGGKLIIVYLTPCDPMNSSLQVSSVHGIFQARMLEWVAFSYSRGSSRPRIWTCISCISCIGRWILYHCATWEAKLIMPVVNLLSLNSKSTLLSLLCSTGDGPCKHFS